MFYDIFKRLCDENGISVTRATEEIGLSRTIGTKWKQTKATPQGETLNKIAEFFGVSVDYLLTGEEKEKPLINGDEELTEYLEELRTRPEVRMLFSVSKGATKEDVEKAVAIIEALRKAEGRG